MSCRSRLPGGEMRKASQKRSRPGAAPPIRPDGVRPVEWALFATPVADWTGEEAAQ